MGLAITIKSTPMAADWGRLTDKFLGDFGQVLADAHLKWVFLVLEYTQKYSRVDTGRSRAAWTPIMDKYGYDYQRSMPVGPRQDEDAIMEGKGEGAFYDDPFNTTIVNNVNYVEPMDRQYGIFGFAPARAVTKKGMSKGLKTAKLERGIRFAEKVPLFEQFGEATFQKLADNAKAAFENGHTFAPKEIEQVENDPPLSI